MMGEADSRKINVVSVSHVVGLLCLSMFGAQKSEGYGGQRVPSDNSSNPFNWWAEMSRFLIGDTLGNPLT